MSKTKTALTAGLTALLCLTLVILALAALRRKIIDETAAYRWVPLTYSAGSLVQVGSQRLPLPITLPPGLSPAGNEALLDQSQADAGGRKHLHFTLFFPLSVEPAVLAWAKRQPSALPLPRGSYSLTPADRGRKVSIRPQAHEWDYMIIPKTSVGDVNLTWFAGEVGKDDSDFSNAVTGHDSPVAGQSRCVNLSVNYFLASSRKQNGQTV